MGKEEAHSADDVQRLYIVLRPESGERPVEEKQDPESGKEGAKTDEDNGKSGEGGGHGSKVLYYFIFHCFCLISIFFNNIVIILVLS